MLRNYDKTYQGNIEFNTDKKAVEAVKTFLEKHLPDFPEFLRKETTGLVNEDGISSKLEIYLQRLARVSDEIFMFQFQYPEQYKRSNDMAAVFASPIASTESIFAIEAKRLPTPGSGRQKEYVQGNLGAMERFKRNYHGKHLEHSAILGYIEKEDFDFWHNQICGWINELIATSIDATIIWNKDDLLSFLRSLSNLNLYTSINSRNGSTSIKLTHYWLYLN
ncbi:MAG: hypothetical protein Q8941_19630 [Bacteroidota bacterium]|nr:hypothetical protein [Bacteroidota bacterium]